MEVFMNKKNHDDDSNTPILDEKNRNKKRQSLQPLTNQDKKESKKVNQDNQKESKNEQEDSIYEIFKDDTVNLLLKENQDLTIDSEEETDSLSNLSFSMNEEISEGEKNSNLLNEKIVAKKELLKKEIKKISIAHTIFHIKEKELKEHQNKLSNAEEVEYKQKLLLANYDMVKSYTHENHNTDKEITHIINKINLSLLQKDKKNFSLSLKHYIDYYRKEKKQRSKNHYTLTLEEKVELFYSNYFTDVIKSEEVEVKYSLLEIMLKNYDKSIFFETITQYEIPLNIPIRETISSTPSYYPLWYMAIMFNKLEFIDDCLQDETIMYSFNDAFYSKIIEDDEIIEYEYLPFNALSKLNENQIIYLIDKDFINSKTEVFMSFDKKKNLFIFLMEQNYLEAFKMLYQKELEKESLKDSSITKLNLKKVVSEKNKNNLLHLYVYALNKEKIKQLDKNMIHIFIKEEFDLDYLNSDDLCIFDYCDNISDENLYLLCEYLYPIIPEHYKKMPNIEVIHEENNNESHSFTTKDKEYTWYDKDKLILHEKEVAKLKEASNHDYIKSMLNSQNYLKKNLIVEDESLFDKLEVEFPNFKEVINFYKGQFRVKKMSGKVRISPILLLGDPGIGKSYFAKKLSQYLKTGYTFLDMGSLSAGWVLTGNNGTWKDAKQGKILEAIMSSKTINPIVVMDELDKTNKSNYDPVSVLYQLLEEINAKEFTDEFIDFPIDASGIVYIACANSIQNISDALLSRFKIFEISNPDEQQITHIIHNIYQENVKDLPIFEQDIADPIVYKLKKFSLRAIKVMIEDAVSTALLELSNKELNDKSKHIILDEKHFIEPKKKTVIGF
jgi:ATP-dependent Lon protease